LFFFFFNFWIIFQQKYNRNINIVNPYNNLNDNVKEGENSLKTSKDKFHTINTNNLNNSKSFSKINFNPNLNTGSGNNLNDDFKYNAMKTNESENSDRSSPQNKTNSKNSFYQNKITKTDGNNRIPTDSDFTTASVIKNKIPLSNKYSKNEPYKVFYNLLLSKKSILFNYK